MKTVIITFVTFIITACNLLPSSQIEILAPPQNISTIKNYVYIIGRTDAQLVEIKLNNQKYCDIIIKDSVFHKQIFFGYGLNEVEVTPISSGQVVFDTNIIKIEIMYAPDIERQYKKIYNPYIFHDLTPKKECTISICHDCDCDDLANVDDATICLDCHPSTKVKFNKHTKVDDRSCIMCHELGTDLQAMFDSRKFSTNPCFKCHNDKITSFDQEFVHGPVAAGSCIICHSPHGSRFEKSLKEPEVHLCISCHEDIEDEMELKVLHKPFYEGECGKCHDPHSTSNQWVLLKSSEKLCFNCHDLDGAYRWHQHPYNVKPKKELVVQLPLTDRGQLECLSCHNPHSSRSEHLLKTKSKFTCNGCHDKS